MEQDQNIPMKLSLVNAIIGYLGSQPYAHVAQLIARIQQNVADANKSDE